jgi:hypothetical protein
MTKSEIDGILEQIATLLELKGENPFKIRAYTNAARAIETFGANIPDLQDEEAVAKIPGIGKALPSKSKSLLVLALWNTSKICVRNSRRPFWNCSRFPVWVRKRSTPFMSGCTSVQLSSSSRLARRRHLHLLARPGRRPRSDP